MYFALSVKYTNLALAAAIGKSKVAKVYNSLRDVIRRHELQRV
jgi:hypothetical protein